MRYRAVLAAVAALALKVEGAQEAAETRLSSEDEKDMTKENEYDVNFYLHGVKAVRN
jgi:hypothetical protein